MDTRGKKRKREQQLLRPVLEGAIVQSPPAVSTSVRAADLESGEGSSESITSDAGSAKVAADDVLHIANALCKVCAKSPKAVVEFVRQVSPATISRSIDWDVIRDDEARKMSEGRHRWTDMEVCVFLESCLEEIAAYNITSNTPKNKAWDNLERKMYEKCRKEVNQGQLQYIWRDCKKRFHLWVWLESQATGLGRDQVTSAIVTDESWWISQNGIRKGVMVFRNDPLKHIDLHHAVFDARTVVGNHSHVAGAAQAAPREQYNGRPSTSRSSLGLTDPHLRRQRNHRVQIGVRGKDRQRRVVAKGVLRRSPAVTPLGRLYNGLQPCEWSRWRAAQGRQLQLRLLDMRHACSWWKMMATVLEVRFGMLLAGYSMIHTIAPALFGSQTQQRD